MYTSTSSIAINVPIRRVPGNEPTQEVLIVGNSTGDHILPRLHKLDIEAANDLSKISSNYNRHDHFANSPQATTYTAP